MKLEAELLQINKVTAVGLKGEMMEKSLCPVVRGSLFEDFPMIPVKVCKKIQ